MCDPFTLFAAATAVSAGATIYNAVDAKKTRKKEAARQKEEAQGVKRDSDLKLRDERSDGYQTNRRTKRQTPTTAGQGGFSTRSFFQAA